MRAAAQFLFQTLQVQATADSGTDCVLADVHAVAQGFAAGCRGASVAQWRTQRCQQPTAQLFVGATFEPQALQPMLGECFTGQANRGDPAVLDTHPFTDRTPGIVISQYRAVVEPQALIDIAQQLRLWRGGAGGAYQQRGTLTAGQAEAGVGKRLAEWSQRLRCC